MGSSKYQSLLLFVAALLVQLPEASRNPMDVEPAPDEDTAAMIQNVMKESAVFIDEATNQTTRAFAEVKFLPDHCLLHTPASTEERGVQDAVRHLMAQSFKDSAGNEGPLEPVRQADGGVSGMKQIWTTDRRFILKQTKKTEKGLLTNDLLGKIYERSLDGKSEGDDNGMLTPLYCVFQTEAGNRTNATDGEPGTKNQKIEPEFWTLQPNVLKWSAGAEEDQSDFQPAAVFDLKGALAQKETAQDDSSNVLDVAARKVFGEHSQCGFTIVSKAGYEAFKQKLKSATMFLGSASLVDYSLFFGLKPLEGCPDPPEPPGASSNRLIVRTPGDVNPVKVKGEWRNVLASNTCYEMRYGMIDLLTSFGTLKTFEWAGKAGLGSLSRLQRVSRQPSKGMVDAFTGITKSAKGALDGALGYLPLESVDMAVDSEQKSVSQHRAVIPPSWYAERMRCRFIEDLECAGSSGQFHFFCPP